MTLKSKSDLLRNSLYWALQGSTAATTWCVSAAGPRRSGLGTTPACTSGRGRTMSWTTSSSIDTTKSFFPWSHRILIFFLLFQGGSGHKYPDEGREWESSEGVWDWALQVRAGGLLLLQHQQVQRTGEEATIAVIVVHHCCADYSVAFSWKCVRFSKWGN